MRHEKIIRRDDGSRIKIIILNLELAEIQKALKGKRFYRVAPIWVSEKIEGLYNNGGGLLDENGMSIYVNGESLWQRENQMKFLINRYSSQTEVAEAIYEAWQAAEPKK